MMSALKHGNNGLAAAGQPRLPALSDEHIPLLHALAPCCGNDAEEGFAAIGKAVTRARHGVRHQLRWKATWLAIGNTLALIAVVAIMGDVFGFLRQPAALFAIEAVAVMQPLLALVTWQIWQNGLRFPETPRQLPHEPDKLIEPLLAAFQQPLGPRVRRLSRRSGSYERVDQRLFFSRLRYLLLSVNPADRSQVQAFGAFFSMKDEFYVTRDDAEWLLAASKPKRKGGPGRDPKYPYLDAALDAVLDGEIVALDLSNPDAAMHRIERWMVTWFENHVPETGEVPRIDLVRPYARRVFEALSRKT